MLDLRNGTGEYDAFMVGAFWYGDIAPQGYAFEIDELIESGSPDAEAEVKINDHEIHIGVVKYGT